MLNYKLTVIYANRKFALGTTVYVGEVLNCKQHLPKDASKAKDNQSCVCATFISINERRHRYNSILQYSIL
jgi:hypothetical protein